MKIKTKLFLMSSMLLFIITSCKKNDVTTTTNGGKAGTLSASSSTLVLDRSKQNDTGKIVVFSFSRPNYGYSAAVSNTLQIDVSADNFASPVSVAMGTTSTTTGYTTSDFNTLLLKLKLTGGSAGQVQARIVHTLSADVAPIYSNVITLTVTPYNLASYIYVAGAYEGWAVPSVNLVGLVSPTSNGIYTGIVDFTTGNLDFKILPENQDYNGNIGAGAGAGTITQGTGNPPNLTAPASGGLLLTVDLNKNTITYTPQWSVIGDATPGGWGSDTNMYFDATTGNYYITVTLVSDGSKAIKFRLNNAWTVNLGGSNGTLSSGGANIIIPATPAGGSSYLITLNPTADTYTLVKQ